MKEYGDEKHIYAMNLRNQVDQDKEAEKEETEETKTVVSAPEEDSIGQDNENGNEEKIVMQAMGNDIIYDGKEILIKLKDGQAVIKITETEIVINAQKSVTVQSKGDIDLLADENINLKAQKDIAIEAGGKLVERAKKGYEVHSGGSSITLDGEIQLGARTIRMN